SAGVPDRSLMSIHYLLLCDGFSSFTSQRSNRWCTSLATLKIVEEHCENLFYLAAPSNRRRKAAGKLHVHQLLLAFSHEGNSGVASWDEPLGCSGDCVWVHCRSPDAFDCGRVAALWRGGRDLFSNAP